MSCVVEIQESLQQKKLYISPKDKSRLGQMKDGGEFLSGLMGSG